MTKSVQEQIDYLMETFDATVELHPALKPHLYVGTLGMATLHHPFVIMPFYSETLNKFANDQFERKTRSCAKALEDKQWATYVFLHERPYRLDALMDLVEMGAMSPTEYWEMVAEVWIDSENIREYPEQWEMLLSGGPEGSDAMMFDYEHQALAALSDTVFLYQGHTGSRDDGWSWTTEYETARWFAHRFATLEDDTPMLTTGRVRKDDVLAMFTRRGEMEILVNPACVELIDTVSLTKESES